VEALVRRFPDISAPRKDDICYATQNRQDAVKDLARRSTVVLVVGSPNSSNSNRLREVAEGQGVPAYMIDGPDDIQRDWLRDCSSVGITAGASAPEVLVHQVVERLRSWGATGPRELNGRSEQMVFALPRELRPKSESRAG
jgi:4-hydroxy-3-methylbut-2-enyl diphosphate reductase